MGCYTPLFLLMAAFMAFLVTRKSITDGSKENTIEGGGYECIIWDDDHESAEAFQQAHDEFKAATIEEKAAYEVWFKCVGRNKYAMFDEMARERGTWDDLCVEPQKRAFARRGLCKPCKKYYDDSKGLEAHEKRHHPRPPSQDSEREDCKKKDAPQMW